jgi:hypothetical protein
MTEREQEFFQLCERLIQHGERMQERLDWANGRFKRAAKACIALRKQHEALIDAHAVENEASEVLLGAAMERLDRSEQ